MRKLRFGLAGAAILVLGVIAVGLIFTNETNDNPWLTATFAVTAGISFVAAGLVALWRRPDNGTGFLLTATGYVWFLGALGESSNSWAWTVGFCLGSLAFVVFLALILAYPSGTLDRRERWLVAIPGAIAIGSSMVTCLVVEYPQGEDRPASAIALTNRPGWADAIDLVATVVIVPFLLSVIVILVRRWRRASTPLRRLLRPVYATCAIALTLLVAGVLVDRVSDTAYTAVWLLFLLSFAAVPLSFLWGVLRSRRERISAASLLLSLDEGSNLQDALARALHDPSLEVAYWLEDGARWIDAEGREVSAPTPSPGRAVTMVDRKDMRVAALRYDAALDDEPRLVDSVAAAAALFLHNGRLQAQARAQYAFLETVANTAPSLLVVVAPDGRILNQNRATVRASGLADEELIRGRFFWDVFIDPDERDQMRTRFAAAAPGFPASEYENTFVNARGERRVIAWESAPVLDDDGTVISIVAGGLDITERKRREEEAHAGSERLRAVIEGAPVAILEVGLDDAVRGWNPAAERIFGWSAAEILGQPVPLAPPERREELQALFLRIRSGDSYTGFETVRQRRDGSLVDVEISAAPIRGTSGAVVGHMAVFSDITERKQREVELRRESEFLRTVADSIESLLVNVDEDAVVVGHSVNNAFTRRLGWAEDEMRGRLILDLFASEERAGALETIRAAVDGAAAAERESRWTGRDGTAIDVAWIATRVIHPSGDVQAVVSGTDITERNRHQEEVRASRARIMQAADDARRRLERDLHDGAQQRLVALSLSLRLAEAKLHADPGASATILAGAREELAHALDELRELARGIHPAVLSDRGLAAAVESLVTRSPFPVETELPDDRLPPPVEAAAYFVVAEALTNVAKYADATTASVRVYASDGEVTIEVSDDGVGGADPGAGTGLRGLADRVAALDGSLRIESPAGQGTRVVAHLPTRRRVLSL